MLFPAELLVSRPNTPGRPAERRRTRITAGEHAIENHGLVRTATLFRKFLNDMSDTHI